MRGRALRTGVSANEHGHEHAHEHPAGGTQRISAVNPTQADELVGLVGEVTYVVKYS